MTTKTVSGNIYCNETALGEFTLEYEDAKESRTTEAKETRTLTAKVLVDDMEIGSVTLEYEDLICSGAGGKRIITLTGDVILE